MITIESKLTIHRANLDRMIMEHEELTMRAESIWIACQSQLLLIQDLERQQMPVKAVDLEPNGEPNPNAGTVQAYPGGRW